MGGRGSESTLHNSKERELARLFNATRGPVHREIMRQAHETAREFTADHPIARGKVDGIMSYDEFRKRYPEAWDLYKQNESDYRTTLTAYALTHPLPNGHSVIAVNPALMNPRILYRTYLRDQRATPPFHPAGTTARDIIYHEMGHAAHHAWDAERRRIQSPYAQLNLVTTASLLMLNNGHRSDSEGNKSFRRAAARVSEYAKKNDYELVAEALADARANGKHAQPLSRTINYTINNHEKAIKRAQRLLESRYRKRMQKRAKR
ncbi:hypothetical protein CQR46_0945 [Bifidobacterium pseudolongum subsp. globosum]|uniref:Uncharacterized protein n=1 Tax=Bifidobacterium pseudolongum subsp. globosum TaxID=1690 RepID=A0A2N3QHJ8_9BIFI|nr:hypothetical protein [Bifidobacterium pseudolongum]PKU90749.1 hypothetical protein CQR46_0945 [Bifidobacterium pseudolongum subsp. globosum]